MSSYLEDDFARDVQAFLADPDGHLREMMSRHPREGLVAQIQKRYAQLFDYEILSRHTAQFWVTWAYGGVNARRPSLGNGVRLFRVLASLEADPEGEEWRQSQT